MFISSCGGDALGTPGGHGATGASAFATTVYGGHEDFYILPRGGEGGLFLCNTAADP